jgi:K+ transporter
MTARLGAFASSSGERGAPPLLLQRRHRGLLIVLGLFGAGLLYGGDGVITPAISVLLIVFGPIMLLCHRR